MTTTTKQKPLSKEELVELVMGRCQWHGSPRPKWQTERSVEAVLDVICDALAERREVLFLHRFRLVPFERPARTTHVPVPGEPGKTRQVDLPAKWGVRVRLGDWLQKQINRGRKPRSWSGWSVGR